MQVCLGEPLMVGLSEGRLIYFDIKFKTVPIAYTKHFNYPFYLSLSGCLTSSPISLKF